MNTIPLIDIGGIWHITYFFGISLTALIWAWKKTTIPISARLLWAYALIQALFLLEYPALHFGEATLLFQVTAGQVLAELVFIPVGAHYFSKYFERALIPVIGYTLICIWMNEPGLMGAQSFNAAFAAATVPFLPLPLAIATLITVVTHHAGTALMIFTAQIFAFAVKGGKKQWVSFLLAMPVALFLVWYHQAYGAPFWEGQGRILKYRQLMTFWTKETRWLILGVGPGTFMWTSLVLDKFTGKSLWLQMHSDWLQVLFELGVVGLGLAIAVFASAVKAAWNDTRLLAGLFGCAAFALTYHPLRFYPTAALTAFIFWQALSYSTDSIPSRPRWNWGRQG